MQPALRASSLRSPSFSQLRSAEWAVAAAGVYVDATFGRGGHSRRILSCLNEQGRLVALDRDPQAIAAGEAIADSRFQLVHRAFGEIGLAGHWIKILLHHLFLHKARMRPGWQWIPE